MFALNFLSYTTVKNQLSWNALTPTHKTLSPYGRKYPELIVNLPGKTIFTCN